MPGTSGPSPAHTSSEAFVPKVVFPILGPVAQPAAIWTSPSTTPLDVALFAQDDFLAVLLQLADAHDGPNHIRDVELDVDILPVLRDEANFLLPVVLQRFAR